MIKEIFYDWGGFNTKLFQLINNIFIDKNFDNFFIFFDEVSGHHNFQYHFTILIILSFISLMRVRQNKDLVHEKTMKIIELSGTMLVSLFFTYALIFQTIA